MHKRLCIDLGNTRCKIGIFDGDNLIFHHVTEDLVYSVLDEMMTKYEVLQMGICHTRNIDETLMHQILDKWHPFILNDSAKLPIENLYETPSSLGKDRLASVVGASIKYPNENCVVVNAGTCITYDFIDFQNQYQGGNIAPGINMRLQAMHQFTDKLPLAAAQYHETLLGKNTKMALQNGAVRGAIFEFDSFIEHIQAKFGPLKSIISGGDAFFFAENSKFEIFAHSNLVLEGLKDIMRFNDR